jgi:hypothetical protein
MQAMRLNLKCFWIVHHKRWQIEDDLVVSFVAFEVFVRTLPGDSILEDLRKSSHQACQEHKEHKGFSSPFSGQYQLRSTTFFSESIQAMANLQPTCDTLIGRLRSERWNLLLLSSGSAYKVLLGRK